MNRLPFYSDCVGWPRHRLAVLEHLVDEGKPIGVDWFARNVELGGIDGYWPLSELVSRHRAGSWGSSFYRLPGWPVFWLVNSSTEYVFAEPHTIEALAARAAH